MKLTFLVAIPHLVVKVDGISTQPQKCTLHFKTLISGETRNRIRYGFGQYNSITGDIFTGQWRNGRKSGFGMTRSWMGHSFIGANNNGQMEGFGRFTHSDGTAYEGQYTKDNPVGVHQVTFVNGTTALGMGKRGSNGLSWTILNSQEVF